jgi:hypothetical protein
MIQILQEYVSRSGRELVTEKWAAQRPCGPRTSPRAAADELHLCSALSLLSNWKVSKFRLIVVVHADNHTVYK